MNIKQLAPKKSSKYKQGYIDPRSCKKLIDPSNPIIYRSSYEYKFTIWCENNPYVKCWGSECVCISYLMPDGSIHRYFPDYYVEMIDGSKYIIEIKPSNQTKPPRNNNSWAKREWIRNSCKWIAAKQYCESKNIKFKILTEHTISKL